LLGHRRGHQARGGSLTQNVCFLAVHSLRVLELAKANIT